METYIIAEVGQNHNGDMDMAMKLIDMAAMPVFEYFSGQKLPGVNAVKFTKRDLTEEMTDMEANRLYNSPHSFGKTYLEHRKALELDFQQHAELEKYAHSKGLDFIETLCSPGCLEILDYVNVDAIKIASRDVNNVPLLEKVGELPARVVLSSGMSTVSELKNAIKILSKTKKKIDILHCISEYPANYMNVNLRAMEVLRKHFPGHKIGYSDHTVGIVVPVAAVAIGAEIIEKHITLNRNMKGSDHAGALEPEGLWRMTRNIRITESSLGVEAKHVSPAVLKAKSKLERSLALQVPLKQGEILKENYLCMRSPGTGLRWSQRDEIIGKAALRDLPVNCLINSKDFRCVKENSEINAEQYSL